MRVTHHGGHEGVTGSCHQLHLESGASVLVDCGLFQGDDARRHPNLEIDFDLTGIEALLLTHVHIDHVGRLPYLFAAGFRKPIFCSEPTARLLPLMIEDALKIGFTRNPRMIDAFLGVVGEYLHPLSYGSWHTLGRGTRIRFMPAGHILGSAYIEVDDGGQRIVFSGDLGAPFAPLLKDPQPPERADLLILESTYGDKVHAGREQRQQTLEGILRQTLDNHGVTIIPAFSLGRTQEVLYEMNHIFTRLQSVEGRSVLKAVDVIVDSPLASRFTQLYSEMQPFWDAEAQQLLTVDSQPLVFENLTTISDHTEHLSTLDYLDKSKLPAIVIAGSGMCTGGRVVNYLKRFLPEPTTDIVFLGYQGRGTPGRVIQAQQKRVLLDEQEYPIAASVHSLSGYSAHADQQNLVDFVQQMPTLPQQVVLVHGEDRPKAALRARLEKLGIPVS